MFFPAHLWGKNLLELSERDTFRADRLAVPVKTTTTRSRIGSSTSVTAARYAAVE